MKYLLLFFVTALLISCSPKLTGSFSRLSGPEKSWVLLHPFKAKKGYRTTVEVRTTVDSMARRGTIGNDNNGGHLDAFKHSLWMARLTQHIGERAANSLGIAHEKGNYKAYLRRKYEEGVLPDEQSSEMDFYNNAVGISVGRAFERSTNNNIIDKLLDSLNKGKLRVLNKDSQGYFLDCHNRRIPPDSLLNRWNTIKCLVPSNSYSY